MGVMRNLDEDGLAGMRARSASSALRSVSRSRRSLRLSLRPLRRGFFASLRPRSQCDSGVRGTWMDMASVAFAFVSGGGVDVLGCWAVRKSDDGKRLDGVRGEDCVDVSGERGVDVAGECVRRGVGVDGLLRYECDLYACVYGRGSGERSGEATVTGGGLIHAAGWAGTEASAGGVFVFAVRSAVENRAWREAISCLGRGGDRELELELEASEDELFLGRADWFVDEPELELGLQRGGDCADTRRARPRGLSI